MLQADVHTAAVEESAPRFDFIAAAIVCDLDVILRAAIKHGVMQHVQRTDAISGVTLPPRTALNAPTVPSPASVPLFSI